MVGCSIVSPSANEAWNSRTPATAATEPGTSPVAPSSPHDAAQSRAMTMSTRVRRRSVITRSTRNCRDTMTAVLTANANPITSVETSLTCRAYAGKPASSWP